MPSRITRNSHRPRASDRTMVAYEATSSLAALSNSMALPPSAKKPYQNGQPAKLLHGCETTVGWISRKNLALRSRRSFLLTSLFIELIDLLAPKFHPHSWLVCSTSDQRWLSLEILVSISGFESLEGSQIILKNVHLTLVRFGKTSAKGSHCTSTGSISRKHFWVA